MRGPAVVMEPTHDHMFPVESLIENPKQAAQDGMLLELLQEMRELVVGDIKDVFAWA